MAEDGLLSEQPIDFGPREAPSAYSALIPVDNADLPAADPPTNTDNGTQETDDPILAAARSVRTAPSSSSDESSDPILAAAKLARQYARNGVPQAPPPPPGNSAYPDLGYAADAQVDAARPIAALEGGASTLERTKRLTYETLQGLGGTFHGASEAVAMAGGAVPVILDKLHSLLSGHDDTSLQDWWFKEMVDPYVQEESAFQLGPDATFADKAVHAVGQTIGMISEAILAGPEATETELASMGGRAVHGMKAMTAPAAQSAIQTGRQVLESTGDKKAALAAATTSYATTTLMGAVPGAMGGRFATRVASGAAIGAGLEEGQRVVQNATLPSNMQQPFSAENLGIGALSGGLFGAIPVSGSGFTAEQMSNLRPSTTPGLPGGGPSAPDVGGGSARAADPLRQAGAAVDRAAAAAQGAEQQGRAQAAQMTDADLDAHPRFQQLLANAQGMDPAAARAYAKQTLINEMGQQAALKATADAVNGHVAAATAQAAAGAEPPSAPTADAGSAPGADAGSAQQITAADFSKAVKQAREAGIDSGILRAVSQSVIRRQITPADGIEHLRAAIEAARPKTPEKQGETPSETRPEPTPAVGTEVQPSAGQNAGGHGQPAIQGDKAALTQFLANAPIAEWNKESIATAYREADRVGIVNNVLSALVDGKTGTEVATDLRKSGKLPGDSADAKLAVNAIRAVHGVPSQDDPQEFQKWQQSFNSAAAPAPAAEQPEPAVETAPAPAAKAPRTNRNLNSPDATRDSALQFIAKSGGVNITEAESEGFDPADMKGHRAGIKRAFHKNGMSIESAGEALAQAGYPVTDEKGAVDKTKVLGIIEDELRGTPRHSTQRDMGRVEREHQAEQAHREQWEQDAAAADIHATPGTPAYAEQDEPTRDFSALADRARQFDPDAVERALEVDDDTEAERRLREIIDRGTQSQQSADAQGSVGSGEEAGQGEPAASGRAPGEEGQPAQEVAASLPEALRPPLRPEGEPKSINPQAPPGKRWYGDRGASPGESAYFLDANADDLDSAKAAIREIETEGSDNVAYEATVIGGDGEPRVIGTYNRLNEAARAAEHAVDHGALTLSQQTVPREGRPAPKPQATDLFGASPVAQQALADAQSAKDEARNSGQQSVETGNPNDLFSQARQQTDLTDDEGHGFAVGDQVRSRGPEVGTIRRIFKAGGKNRALVYWPTKPHQGERLDNGKRETFSPDSEQHVDLEKLTKVESTPPADTSKATERAPAGTPDERAIAAFRAKLSNPNERYRSIIEARQDYQKATGTKVDSSNVKHVDELLEQAVVHEARDIVSKASSPQEAYDRLVQLYERQPKLGTRTSTSIADQAYSTPAPLAYLGSELTGIGRNTTVYEPTAGNGMLLIGADPAKVTANELNPDRAKALQDQGFKPSVGDALDPAKQPPPGSIDAVITNPPFGAVKGENGQSRLFSVKLPDGSTLNTTNVDFAIALKALEAMKPDGRATLIVGSIAKTVTSPEARSDAYNGSARRKFFYGLYRNYNVTDHFTVAGELYEKQGAGWPVDVITIGGRGKSARALPAVDVPRVYTDWASLKGVLEQSRVERGDNADVDRVGTDNEGSGAEPVGNPVPPRGPALDGSVPEPARGPDSANGQRLRRSEASGEGPAGGPVPGRTAAGRGESADRGSGGVPGVEQSGDRGTPESVGSGAEGAPASAGDEGGAGGDQLGPVRPGDQTAKLGESTQPPAVTEGPQVPYRPASRAKAIGTLVPSGMQTAVQDSLAGLQKRVGPLNEYVAKELGYPAEDIGRYFSAEQVDALSLALDQMGRGAGFIIGDQTGVGKGRVVAGIIRYALKKGLTPIFVTEKPNLYADMYRDLKDIGQSDVRPIMTNGAEKVPLDDAGNVILKTPAASKHNADLTRMAGEASLGDHNIVFTTYSQMQTLKGELTARQRFLQAMAQNAIVIFDESHNAGGNDSERKNARQKSMDGDTGKTGRAAFARALAGMAKGVFYSSATYAKRPSVMDLYFKTDMAKAVEGDVRKLPGAISAGGVPLQQVVAAMLTKAGQYVRRERSFDGVEYNTPVVPVDRKAAEGISRVMLGVKQFDDLKEAAVANLKKELKAEAATVSGDNAVGKGGVESTNFTAIMHNLIDQMLLALKADAAADKAIESLRRGEKPVVTLSNTMGSFLESYVDAAGLKPGDTMALSFRDLLKRYLERSRIVKIKKPGDKGSGTPHYITDQELGARGVSHYRNVMKMIDAATDIQDVPVSPIDWLHHRLRQAGFTSAEITGRTHTLQYGPESGPVYRPRSSKETSIAGRRAAITGFNSGKVDAMILNQAGSTGLSLHASEKFQDQRRRRMIIAQAEKNIDTHMQMLGRVHRTGQVIAPAYDQLVADVPAEKRPAAVLAKKMASLNANTTASRSSQFTAKDSVDFLNPYGDEVAAQLMEDMPDVHIKLGEPLEHSDIGYEREDAARKVTGRIPLLPVAEQEQLYNMLESSYKEAIERADAMGENALEAKTLPLDARRLARTELFAGTQGDESPFAAGAYADTIDAKRLGKPYTSEQVRGQVADAVSGKSTDSIEQLAARGAQQQRDQVKSVTDEYHAYRTQEESRMLASDMPEGARQGRLAALDGQLAKWRSVLDFVHPGGQYELTLPDGTSLYGVATEIRRKKGVKMPVAGGAWSVQFAVADGMRAVSLPLSKMAVGRAGPDEGRISIERRSRHPLTGAPVMKMFDDGQTTSREHRVVVSGNLLAGYSKVGKGQIVAYTTNDGRLEQGILMPRSFDLKEFAESQPVELASRQLGGFFVRADSGLVKTADGNLTIRKTSGGYQLLTPRSKAEGGRYYLDQGLRDIVGDFTSSGSSMRVDVSPDEMERAASYIESQMGQRLRTGTHRAEALAVGGTAIGSKAIAERGTSRLPVAGRGEVREDLATYEEAPSQRPPAAAEEAPPGSAGRRAPSSVREEPPRVFENSARPVAARTTARLLSRVQHVETGRFTTSLTHINTWQDAAHLIAPLRKSAQEQVLAIVLDAENRPLTVLRYSIGHIDEAMMHPGIIAGAAARTPKAASVYLAHNHPSGSLMPSGPDEKITQHAAEVFQGTNIKLNGMLIVAPGRKHATFFEPGQFMHSGEMTRAPRRGTSVPQIERRLIRIPKDAERYQIKGIDSAAHVLNRVDEPSGVLLLNYQDELAGVLPIPDEAMRNIGFDGNAGSQLLAAVEESNATGVIPFGSRHGAHNTGSFLANASQHVRQMMTKEDGKWTNPWGDMQAKPDTTNGKPKKPARETLAEEPSPPLSPQDEARAQEAAQAHRSGDDEALDRALRAMKLGDEIGPHAVGDAVRRILEKERIESSDQPAMDQATAELLVGPVIGNSGRFDRTNPSMVAEAPASGGGGAGAGTPPRASAGAVPEDPDITAIRRRVMANAKYEGLKFRDRVRLMMQRWTGLSGLAIRQGMVDSFASISAYEKLLNEGKLLDASASPYKQTVATQNLPSVMTAIMHTGVPVWQDGAYVRAPEGRKGLLDIFSPLVNHPDGNLLPQWELYAAARRANRLIDEKNADGTSREKLFTREDIDRSLQLAEQYPAFDQVFNDWQDFNRQVLDMAQEAGLIDPESRAVWESNDYVPFYRAVQDVSGTVNPVSLRRAISDQRAKIRTLKGGAQPLEDVFESMLMNTAHLVDSSFKNRAAQTIVNMFDGVATSRVPMDREAVHIDADQVARALKTAGIDVSADMTPEQREQWFTFFRGIKPAGDNIVTVRFGGKPRYFEVHDPLLYQAMTQINPSASMRWLDLLGFTGAKRLLTRGATALPAFMVRNFVRDTAEAWTQNHVGLKPFVSAAKGFVEFYRNEPLVHDLMLAGAGGDAVYDNQPGKIKKILLKQMKEQKAQGILSTVLSPKRLWGAYTKLQQASEQANRLAVYKASLAQGHSHAEAAYRAHDVLNFQQRGAWPGMQFFVRVVPFLNARVQGLDRLARSYQENRGAFLLKGGILTAMTLALMAASWNDPRYQELEEWDRDAYWHMFIGPMHLRIPKPFELGALFGTLPERAIRKGMSEDTWRTTWGAITRLVTDTFAFNPIPQLAKPAIEDTTNYDFFTGRPIVSDNLKGTIPELQSAPWTSPTITSVANALPEWMPDSLRSPVRLEHWIRGYTANLGMFGFTVADRLTRAAGGYPDAPSKPWYDYIPAQPVTTSTPHNTKWTDELYRMQQQADATAKGVIEYEKAGEYDRARKLVQERGQEIAARPRLNQLAKAMRDLNTRSRAIMQSKLSGDQKAQMLEKINERRAEIARQVAPYSGTF